MDKIDTDEMRFIPPNLTVRLEPGAKLIVEIRGGTFVGSTEVVDYAPAGVPNSAREADLQARLDEARAAWEAFEGATITDDHHAAVDRIRAALFHPANGEGAA